MLQAYVAEGGTLKPVSGDLAALGRAYWIDVYDPTPEEQKAIEQALGVRVRVPEEPTRFQISAPLRSADGTTVLTALLLTNLDVHGRSHAVLPRLVARRHDDPAMLPAHRDRLAPEVRIVALLHRRVEGVHVDMDDFSKRAVGVGHGRIFCPTGPPRV